MAVELGIPQTDKDTEMEKPVGSPPVWDEIELAESYLVCSMFEDASSLASSVLKRLCDKECNERIADDIELNDMLESAGMVFVQSLKELGRTMEIISELTQLFDSLPVIPVQVFLAGACFQMQEDPRGAQKNLEEFLSKWKILDEKYFILENLETNKYYMEKYGNRFILEIDTYLQVVEAYLTLLTMTLKRTDVAISWVEKAALPEKIRQELLRRLHSTLSSKDTGSQASTSASPNVTSKSSKTSESTNDAKEAILRYSGQHVPPTLWWFRTLNIKFGGVHFAVSNGSIFITTLILLAYYYMRRKKYSITSILKGQALFVKKSILDLWELAFSYQVNPLAAVEPLQNPTRVNR
ncbi:hypothetical protein L1887_38667 [Cichorium endivia]|nr:hypothetical protein L1887_38667 [Cichorium endivia]